MELGQYCPGWGRNRAVFRNTRVLQSLVHGKNGVKVKERLSLPS